ncbi:MAG: dockerin type I domain-containing protein, partial [Aureliella sp.]
IINDRLRLQVKDAVTLAGNPLDGEWVDGVSSFASGDGTAGGNFNFQFQVLPGDVNRSGAVLSGDANLAFAAINAFTDGTSAFSAPNGNTYTIFKDLNGSGTITSADASLAFARLGFPANVIPAGTPGSLSGSSSASSSVDSVDSILSQFQGWQANSSASSSSELVTDDPATAIAEDKPVDTDLVDQLIVDLADGLL